MSIEFSNNFDSPVNKFEQMLKTNSTLFFDVQDFENIIHFLDLNPFFGFSDIESIFWICC